MAPSPIPAPLPIWAKAVLYLAPLAYELGVALVDYYYEAAQPSELVWTKFVAKCEDTTSLDPADDQYVSWDFMNITGGGVDDTWTLADYDVVFNALGTFLFSWKPAMQTRYSFTQMLAYQRGFNDYGNSKPFADSGPPKEIRPTTHTGTASGPQAPQVASSVTEEIARRENWGRFYMPGLSSSALAASGRISSSVVSALSQATATFYETCMASEIYPVVPVTSVKKTPFRALYTINQVRVDDVADVIRRRRFEQASFRAVHPL